MAEQLKVVTSEEAIKENETRNQQILETIKRFGEDIIALEIKEEDNDDFEKFKKRCQPLINQLEKDLTPAPNRVITSGYIFDLNILKETLDWYKANRDRFDGWYKINIFVVNGYGKLQTKLSPRNAQVMRYGIDRVVCDGDIPPRTFLNTKPGEYSDLHNPKMQLGVDFFIDDRCISLGALYAYPLFPYHAIEHLETLISNKSSSLTRFIQQQANAKNNVAHNRSSKPAPR